LFEPANAKELSDKMIWASDHPMELFETGREGREKIERYNEKNYMEKIIELIK
jgi:hypothetical protein